MLNQLLDEYYWNEFKSLKDQVLSDLKGSNQDAREYTKERQTISSLYLLNFHLDPNYPKATGSKKEDIIQSLPKLSEKIDQEGFSPIVDTIKKLFLLERLKVYYCIRKFNERLVETEAFRKEQKEVDEYILKTHDIEEILETLFMYKTLNQEFIND